MSVWQTIAFFFVAGFVREDAACVAACAMVSEGKTTVAPALIGCIAGFLFGDFFWIALGKAFGVALNRQTWLIKPDELAKWRAWAADKGPIVLFWAGLLPGIRTPVQMAVGTLGVPWRRCVGYVVAACLLYSGAMSAIVLFFDRFLSSNVVEDVWQRRLFLLIVMIGISLVAVGFRAPLTRWLHPASNAPNIPGTGSGDARSADDDA